MTFGTTFLRHPELFPARLAGEPWGSEAVAIDAPGGPYEIAGIDEGQRQALRGLFGGFASQGSGGVRVAPYRVAQREFLPIDRPDWEYTLELEGSTDSLRVAGLNFMALIQWSPSCRAAIWVPELPDDELAFTVENLLRALVAYRMLDAGGLLVHAAAVDSPAGALLFPGRSGSGKTTLSRLAHEDGGDVLNDDLVGVMFGAAGPMVVPTPFGSSFRGKPRPARPLVGILALEKGAEHAMRERNRSAMVASLIVCAPYVNADASRTERLLSVTNRLALAVPAWLLTFAKRPGLWPVVRELAA